MDTYSIDVELEHYYGDRMATTSREACRRFYLRAVSRCRPAELERYLGKVRSHATAYSSLSRMLRSPFAHAEMPLFLSSLVLLISSIVMLVIGQATLLVAGGISAGLVGMLHCARKLAHHWQMHAVRAAVFNEFAEILEQEQSQP
jgi:hypothetical protein